MTKLNWMNTCIRGLLYARVDRTLSVSYNRSFQTLNLFSFNACGMYKREENNIGIEIIIKINRA